MKNIPPIRPAIHFSEESSSEEFSSFSEESSSFSEHEQDPKLELVVIYGPRQLPSEAAFLHSCRYRITASMLFDVLSKLMVSLLE